MSEWVKGWVSELKDEWVSLWVSEWMSKWVSVSECVSWWWGGESVSASECECEWQGDCVSKKWSVEYVNYCARLITITKLQLY